MIKIYYVSGKDNRKIDLTSWPYWMQTGDFLDYEKTYEKNGKRVENFSNLFKERYLTISVLGRNEDEYYQNLDKLHDVFEQDVENQAPGKLYFQNSYLSCYVYSSKKTEWEDFDYMLDNEIWIVPAYPSWIQEQTKQFLPSAISSDTDGLDFPFDFEFDFAADQAGVAHWEIDHYTSSHFLMCIYGPCENPRILVNGYPYQVFTSLASGDYLEINSRKNTVIKYLANGTTENCYNSRLFYPRIFEKIPSGALTFNWSGAFGFDVVLYIERSEPKWS